MITTSMQIALQAVQNNEMTINEAAERFNVDSGALLQNSAAAVTKKIGDFVEFGVRNYMTGTTHQGNLKSNAGLSKMQITEFATITFNDLIKSLGGREKMSGSELKRYEAMYKKIAGEDGVISARELKIYLQTVEKYAGEDKMLDFSEMQDMLISRGERNKDGLFASQSDPSGLSFKFLIALVNANNSKVMAKNTSLDSDGNLVTSQKVVSDEVERVVKTRDDNGNVIKECKIFKDGRKETTEFDASGKAVKKVIEENKNQTTELFLDEKGLILKEVHKENGKVTRTIHKTYHENGKVKTSKSVSEYDTDISYFDEDGDITKKVETVGKSKIVSLYKKGAYEWEPYKDLHYNANGNLEETSLYFRNKDGEVVKIEKIKSDGSKEVIHGDEWEPKKIISYDKDGKVQKTENITYNKNGERVKSETLWSDGTRIVETYIDGWKTLKKEEFDKDGNVIFSVVNTYGKNGKITKQEVVREDGTKLIQYGDEFRLDKIEEFDKDGNLVKITTATKNKQGQITSRTETDAQGNILSSEEFFYDAKGRETIYLKKDSNGNVTKRYDTTYTGKTHRTVVRNSNDTTSLTNVEEIRENEKSVYYRNGQTLCSEEYRNGEWNYKNKDGNDITWDEFNKLRHE